MDQLKPPSHVLDSNTVASSVASQLNVRRRLSREEIRAQREESPAFRPSWRTDPRRRSTALENEYQTRDPDLHYGPRHRSWHVRPKSPDVAWHREYNAASVKNGRVLVVDYMKHDPSKAEGTRQVLAQEFSDIEGLRKLYTDEARCINVILRVVHVQNSFWATQFLLRKFNINARDDLVGSDFGRYLFSKRTDKRRGKPVVSGKTWKTQHDPWRGISKTAFGIDYLKPYKINDPLAQSNLNVDCKMMELNSYDKDDNPAYGYDVFTQRLGVYIQHKEVVTNIRLDPEMKNPYLEDPDNMKGENGHDHQEYFPHLDTLDNGNAILIFESSKSNSFEDTMIPARGKWESRWRRLPFYVAYEVRDLLNDEQMALQCTKMIVQDVWKSAAETWQGLLDCCNHHVGILEEKIYDNPANESRANELFTNSSMWLRVEKLLLAHVDVIRQCQNNLREVTDDPNGSDEWLEEASLDFARVSTRVEEDLVKPTNNLADLMYKSVGIRDSRQSLQLASAMARLSWITFIFLPLTFIVGFFGMHVDTFETSISMKYYFFTAVPMMLAVFAFYFGLKRYLGSNRQTPYARGIYETLFHSLATSYPTLWTRTGPRTDIIPKGTFQRWKWWLIVRWSRADKTISSGLNSADDQDDGLSTASRIKRALTRRWTSEINTAQHPSHPTLEEGKDDDIADGIAEINTMLHLPRPAMLEVPFDMNKRVSTAPASSVRSGSPGRLSSRDGSVGRNSGVMVEEERPSWLDEVDERVKIGLAEDAV